MDASYAATLAAIADVSAAQILDRAPAAYRVGDPPATIPSSMRRDTKLSPGRWNTPASPIIDAREHFPTGLSDDGGRVALAAGGFRMVPQMADAVGAASQPMKPAA